MRSKPSDFTLKSNAILEMLGLNFVYKNSQGARSAKFNSLKESNVYNLLWQLIVFFDSHIFDVIQSFNCKVIQIILF